MKSLYLGLLVFCATIAVPGCGEGSGDNKLANEELTADDFARYEADLAAVTGDDAYEDAQDDDEGAAGTGAGDAGDTGTGDESAE